MAIEELIANKLKCLIQRRHSFDLYDLVYATFFIALHEGDAVPTAFVFGMTGVKVPHHLDLKFVERNLVHPGRPPAS
jgi:hypothetical protein